MGKNTKKLTAYAMFLALSMILGYVESLLPMPFPIPGIKLGLANIVSILGLFSIGAVPTAVITLLRVLLLAILFGNMMTLSYSMAGFLLSFAAESCSFCLFSRSSFCRYAGRNHDGSAFRSFREAFA